MWVFVLDLLDKGTGIVDSYPGNYGDIVYHGQYFLQDEVEPNKVWYWNHPTQEFKSIIVHPNSVNAYKLIPCVNVSGEYAGMRRLDHFNCENYNMCNPSPHFGSRYSVRRNAPVYNHNSTYLGYIGTGKEAAFAGGFGFTHNTRIWHIEGQKVAIRVAGYKVIGGEYYWYPKDPEDKDPLKKFYIWEDIKVPNPDHYIINTL